MPEWSEPFIGLLVCDVLLSLLVLVVRGCRSGDKRRVTFKESVKESEVVEIDTDNYGAAANKVSEGWCEEEQGREEANHGDEASVYSNSVVLCLQP